MTGDCFDQEPDGDLHGECAAEIRSLEGYRDAFYQLGELLSIPAQAHPPALVWEKQIKPCVERGLAAQLAADKAAKTQRTKETVSRGFPGAAEWLDQDHQWLRLSETLACDKMLSIINPGVTLGKYREALNGLVLEISAQERERAARICEGANNFDNPMTARDCADAIRKVSNE
jgi:hypothetical protein